LSTAFALYSFVPPLFPLQRSTLFGSMQIA
jgi:hypothetical protein